MWGATSPYGCPLTCTCISIHAPRVGSDFNQGLAVFFHDISIHAPRVGSDRVHKFDTNIHDYFNPRSPCGERQLSTRRDNTCLPFQSTLPVWGATNSLRATRCYYGHFNPRSPCGERQSTSITSVAYCLFQSTLPVWGATAFYL